MSRIAGVVETFEKETMDHAGAPSPVEVKRNWNAIVMDADRVESLLAKVYGRLWAMTKWQHLGLVSVDELEQARDWWDTKQYVIKRLLGWRFEDPFLNDTFCDGGGI